MLSDCYGENRANYYSWILRFIKLFCPCTNYLFIYFVQRLKSFQLLINSHIDDKISGGKERKEVGIIVNIRHRNPRETSLNLIVVIESKESFSFETNKMKTYSSKR